VTVLLPVARLLALTVMVTEPDEETGAVPRVEFPAVKANVPVGVAVPLAALTVAVSCVEAVEAITAGFAEAVVTVATAGAVTVTVTVPLDTAKLPAGT